MTTGRINQIGPLIADDDCMCVHTHTHLISQTSTFLIQLVTQASHCEPTHSQQALIDIILHSSNTSPSQRLSCVHVSVPLCTLHLSLSPSELLIHRSVRCIGMLSNTPQCAFIHSDISFHLFLGFTLPLSPCHCAQSKASRSPIGPQ